MKSSILALNQLDQRVITQVFPPRMSRESSSSLRDLNAVSLSNDFVELPQNSSRRMKTLGIERTMYRRHAIFQSNICGIDTTISVTLLSPMSIPKGAKKKLVFTPSGYLVTFKSQGVFLLIYVEFSFLLF